MKQHSGAPSFLSDGRVYCLFLLVLPFIMFWRNILPDQLVVTSDSNLVTFMYVHETLVSGEARWMNLWWLGMPGAPPEVRLESLLLLILSPVGYAKLSIQLYLAIAGLMGYWLGRTIGFSRFCALVLGLGWELIGSNLTDIPGGHHSRQLMFGFVPLMYLGLWKAAVDKKVIGAVVAGVAVAIMVAHAVDVAMLQALGGVAFFVWFSRRALGTARFWIQSVIGSVVTLLLASQLIFAVVPGLTTGLKSEESGAGPVRGEQQAWEWHTQWSFAPEEVLELFAPGFFGWQTGAGEHPYWGRVGRSESWEQTQQGFKNFRIDNPTTGSAVTALAILGIATCWRRRRLARPELGSAARFFTVMGGITFLLSLGRYLPGYRFLFEIPGFEYWRNPNKFFYVTSFCLVFLAAYGAMAVLEAVVESGKARGGGRLRGMAKTLFGVSGALLVGSVLIAVFQDDLVLSFADRLWTREEAVRIVGGMSVACLRGAAIWGIWGGLLMGAAVLAPSHPARLPWLGAAWILVTVAEMWFVASHYIEFFDYKRVLAINPMLERVLADQQKEPSRFKMVVSDALLNSFYFYQLPYYKVQCIDIPQASRVPGDYGYFFEQMMTHPVLMWEMSNVRHVLARKEIASHLQAVYGPGRFEGLVDYRAQDRGNSFEISEVPVDAPGGVYRLLRLRHYLPRVFAVPTATRVSGKEEFFELLKTGKADLEKSVFVSHTAPIAGGDSKKTATQYEAVIRDFTANRIVIDAHADQPAYLVLVTKLDAGWKATVNGHPVPIFRANFIVQGIEIPAGGSEVVFEWEMKRGATFYVAFSAWVGILLLLGCVLFVFRRKKPMFDPR